MKILQIKRMWWGDEKQTLVCLIADTDEGTGLTIGTPYDERSIIWTDVQAYPKELIEPYVVPVIQEEQEE